MILLLLSMGHRATLKMRPGGAVGDGPLCRTDKGTPVTAGLKVVSESASGGP